MNDHLIIIQARSSSTRLPGKVLMPFYQNKTILDLQIEALQSHLPNTPLLVATTDSAADDQLFNHITQKGVDVFRGSENNVLDRFIQAAGHYQKEHIIRVCSDNPFLLNNEVKDLVIESEKASSDYISYRSSEGTPSIRMHWGFYAEYVSLSALKRVAKETADSLYLEHVTNYIYSHEDQFNIHWLEADPKLADWLDLRLTIDDIEDFNFVQSLYVDCKEFSVQEILNQLETRPEDLEKMRRRTKKYSK